MVDAPDTTVEPDTPAATPGAAASAPAGSDVQARRDADAAQAEQRAQAAAAVAAAQDALPGETYGDDQFTQEQAIRHAATLVDDPRGQAGWVVELALKRAGAARHLTREEINQHVQALLATGREAA